MIANPELMTGITIAVVLIVGMTCIALVATFLFHGLMAAFTKHDDKVMPSAGRCLAAFLLLSAMLGILSLFGTLAGVGVML